MDLKWDGKMFQRPIINHEPQPKIFPALSDKLDMMHE